MAVLVAVIRGFVSRAGTNLGNFCVDLTRSVLYILLPISIVGALVLVSQGVVQTLGGRTSTSRRSPAGSRRIAVGPVASQVAIKQLGTNGGGFFSVNSSMPFENPTASPNFVEVLLHPPDSGGADLDVRPHGRQPPARAGPCSLTMA